MKSMDISQPLVRPKKNKEDIGLVNSATMHTILRDKRYFASLIMIDANVNTISSSTTLIEGFGRPNIILHTGTKFVVDCALFPSKSKRKFPSI